MDTPLDSQGTDSLPARFRVADLTVDRASRTVTRGDEEIALPDLSWRLLVALAHHAPAVASQDDLLTELWPDVFVGEETLKQRVRLLRQSLGDDSRQPRYIRTVRGVGYRLATAVEEIDAQDPAGELDRRPASRRGLALAWVGGLGALVLIAAFVAGRWLDSSTTPTPSDPAVGRPAADRTAVAILPFADLSPEGEPTHFGAALHEEILSRLSRVGGFRVAPRTSVLGIGDGTESVRQISARLGVDAVVEGSVRRVGDRIGVSLRLFGADESLLWSEAIEHEFSVEGVLAIQREIAERTAEALSVELSASELQSIARLPTVSLEAYDAYLLGRYHTLRQTPRDLERAVELLAQAVELDPEFAQAWTALASAYSFVGTNYGGAPPRAAYGRAKAAVLRALALDGSLVDARIVYADILTWFDWDYPTAEREYRRVMRAGEEPLGFLILLSIQERHAELEERLETILEGDPSDPWVRTNVAWRLIELGRYDAAIEQARLAGDHRDVDRLLGWAHLGRGEIGLATEHFDRALETSGRHPIALSNLAVAYAAAGRTADARRLLDELGALRDRAYVSSALIAQAHVALGDLDAAFRWLARALEERARDLIFLTVDHAYDGIRDDPRYQELLDAMKPLSS